jgi:hypothetical protein
MMSEEGHPVRKQVRIFGAYGIATLESQINDFLQELRCPPDFVHIHYQIASKGDTQNYFTALVEYWEP